MRQGFVYIWFDTLRRMFYVGSHEGHVGDGYCTSSVRCKRAILRRPSTFKFRVLEHVSFTSRAELNDRENIWLKLIKPSELGVRYYNLKRVAAGGNTLEGKTEAQLYEFSKSVSRASCLMWKNPIYREKILSTPRFGGNTFSRAYMCTTDYSIAMSKATMGEKNGFAGKYHKASSKELMSKHAKARPPNRAKHYIFTMPDGCEISVENLSKYLRELGAPNIKLGKYLKNGEVINSFRNPNHPLTGWKIRHA